MLVLGTDLTRGNKKRKDPFPPKTNQINKAKPTKKIPKCTHMCVRACAYAHPHTHTHRGNKDESRNQAKQRQTKQLNSNKVNCKTDLFPDLKYSSRDIK